MSYESTLAYTASNGGARSPPDRIRTLLDHLGHPEERLKLSTSGAPTARAAPPPGGERAAGRRATAPDCTPPLLNRFNERIRVDGQEITDEALGSS